MFLEKIVRHKIKEVAVRKKKVPLAKIAARALKQDPPRPFIRALMKNGFGLVAEVKKASPSKGVLNLRLNAAEQAKKYEKAGASCISVLTDERFFRGSLADLKAVKGAVKIPVLRKDFILDPYQIFEARAAGADAVLLIASILPPVSLRDLVRLTRKLGMEPLVEVHSSTELKKALAIRPSLLGLNNRDLRTFKTDLKTTVTLMRNIPQSVLVISESGIASYQDVQKLRKAGCRGVLVGESLVTAKDPARKMRALLGEVPEPVSTGFMVKICGITNLKDAQAAIKVGANALGFNFYEGSPRCIDPSRAAALIKKLPAFVRKVGVFVNAPAGVVKLIAKQCGLDTLQFSGDESPSYCGQFQQEVIKAIRIKNRTELKRATAYSVDAYLFDSFNPSLFGGTGKRFNWRLLANKNVPRPFILAGGLAPGNVAEAIREVKPNGVDVCSGVESNHGVKDKHKLKRFLNKVREVRSI